jgi:hypothetical protein
MTGTVMKKLLSIALVLALASVAAGCGRDDRQEKTGAAAAKQEPAAPASAPATDAASAAKGPLQTGEVGAAGAEMPSGTATGARTTPNPK